MRSIRDEFRRIFGYCPEHKCKECKFLVKYTANRSYYKCQKMGITRSSATDVRLKDMSCRLFEEDQDE